MAAYGDNSRSETGRTGEISVLDIWTVLVKHKKMIMAFVLIVGLVTLIFGIVMNYRYYGNVQPYVYRSESVLIPRDATLEQLQAALNDPRLTASVIQRNNLAPLMFPRPWDGKEGRWKTPHPPGLQEAAGLLRKMLEVTDEGGGATLRIVFVHSDPGLAAKMPVFYLRELEEFIRPPVTYYSESEILPLDADLDTLIKTMHNPRLLERVIRRNDLVPVLYPSLWDEKNRRWKTANPPEPLPATGILGRMLDVKANVLKHTIRLVFRNSDPELARKILGFHLQELRRFNHEGPLAKKERRMETLAEIKKWLLDQYAAAGNPDLRKEIAARIVAYGVEEKELELSEVSGFAIISPPSPPRERPFTAFEVSGPPVPPIKVNQLRVYFLLPLLLALIVSIFFAFVLEYWNELRNDGDK